MHIVAIAWMFVVVLMAAAEGMSTTWFAGLMTLIFYGLLPLSLVLYILGTPARRKSRAREQTRQRLAAGDAEPPKPG